MCNLRLYPQFKLNYLTQIYLLHLQYCNKFTFFIIVAGKVVDRKKYKNSHQGGRTGKLKFNNAYSTPWSKFLNH